MAPSTLDGRPVVVFHSENAKHRITNQAQALRSTGRFQTVLFSYNFDLDEQAGSFDEIHFTRSPEHLASQLARLARRAPVHSVICETQSIRNAAVLLAAPRQWPVLVSQYDSHWANYHFARVREEAVKLFSEDEIRLEQEVFPKLDGTIGRFGDLQLLFEEQRVETPLFVRWDLCDRKFFQPIPQRTYSPDHEWSAVSAGLVFPMSEPEKFRGEGQMVRYAESFRQERVHLHVYPSPHRPFHCPEYEAEVRRNPYFHLHPPEPPGRVHRTLAGHDFAWMALDVSRTVVYGDRELATIIPLRLFGYLEAGLPILCSAQFEAVADIIRKYGCGLVLDTPSAIGLRNLLASEDVGRMRGAAGRAREELETLRFADDFARFLDEVRDRWRSRQT